MDLRLNIGMLRLTIVLLCVFQIRTSEVTSWNSLRKKLRDAVEEIFQNDRTDNFKKAYSGKFFKYILNDKASYVVSRNNTVLTYYTGEKIRK